MRSASHGTSHHGFHSRSSKNGSIKSFVTNRAGLGSTGWRPLVDPVAAAAAAEKARKQAAVGSQARTQGNGFTSASTQKTGVSTKDSKAMAGQTGRSRAVLQSQHVVKYAPANKGGKAGSTAAPPVAGPLAGSTPLSPCLAPLGTPDAELLSSSVDLGCERGAEDSLSDGSVISETLQPDDPKPENAPMGGTARCAMLGLAAATVPSVTTLTAGVKPKAAQNQTKAGRRAAMLAPTKKTPADGPSCPTAITANVDADRQAAPKKTPADGPSCPTARTANGECWLPAPKKTPA
eukprot:gene32040-16570_t